MKGGKCDYVHQEKAAMVDHVVGCMDRHVPVGNSHISGQPFDLVWVAAKLGGNYLRTYVYFVDYWISIFQTAFQPEIILLPM